MILQLFHDEKYNIVIYQVTPNDVFEIPTDFVCLSSCQNFMAYWCNRLGWLPDY